MSMNQPGAWGASGKNPAVMRRNRRLSEMRDRLDGILSSDWSFGFTKKGGLRRRWFILVFSGWMWATLAYFVTPSPLDGGEALKLLLYPFQALFYPPVFLFIILLSALGRVGLRQAARYFGYDPGQPRQLRLANLGLAALVGLLWAGLAYRFRPTEFPSEFVGDFLAYPFDALFAAGTFRHAVPAALAFWIAYQAASFYLDDIFEIKDLNLAERFLMQSAFSSQYNLVSIKNGEISPEDRETTAIKIGGPGLIRVHLENAALLESMENRPRIVPDITPDGIVNKGLVELKGFERIRCVVDLRDQMGEFSVEGRTRDGVRIQAKDVRFLFCISRRGIPPTFEHPYPFDPEAVEKQVYDLGGAPLGQVMKSMVRTELLKFIGEHPLVEFLASLSEPEYEENRKWESEIWQQVLQQRSSVPGSPVEAIPEVPFVSRSTITQLFASEIANRAAKVGLELKWIGIGTWVLPAEIISEQHLEAWKLSRENMLRGSPRELERMRRESYQAEFIRLVQEVPLSLFVRFNREKSRPDTMRLLMIAYREMLRRAYEVFKDDSNQAQADRIERVLRFLSRFTFRWLGSRK